MKISRRAFTSDALAAVAVASVVPSALAQQAPPAVPAVPPEQPRPGPEPSATGRAEAEARINSILAKHGHRLSDEQKADVRHLVTGAQPWLESFRAFPLPNAAEPATVFRVRRNPRRPGKIESHDRNAKS